MEDPLRVCAERLYKKRSQTRSLFCKAEYANFWSGERPKIGARSTNFQIKTLYFLLEVGTALTFNEFY